MTAYSADMPEQAHLPPPSRFGRDHLARFYEADGFLLDSLQDFIDGGLSF